MADTGADPLIVEVIEDRSPSQVPSNAEIKSVNSERSIGSKLPAKNSALALELFDMQNKEELLSSPFFVEAIEAQKEVDEKVSGITHRHLYIPRKKPGEITREHEQYNLTYAMMLGIRHSVSIWMSEASTLSKHKTLDAVAVREMKKGVEESHFYRTYKTYFPPEGGYAVDPLFRTPAHLLKTGFKFKDYAPEVFSRLRKRFDIDDMDYLNSLCGSFNYIEFISNSKSGEFFFYSHDGRFLIKTQKRSESKFMRKILPKYYNYVADNPNCLLVRICGAHRVKLPHLRRKMYFVIMMSVFSDATETKPVNRIYDLKGATAGRRANADETVKKDLDIIDDGRKFHLGPKRLDFIMQLEKDSQFLASLGVMDYSLLVGIHERDSSKQNGSFIFRSHRKSSLLGEFDDAPMTRPANTPEGSGLRKTPSLPSNFSKIQVLASNSSSSSLVSNPPVAIPEPGNGTAAIIEQQAPPPPSPKIVRGVKNTAASAIRYSNMESFNSFYKVDSKDATGSPTGETYHLGVIDIFTRYSVKKKGEHLYKSIGGNGKLVSAINPRQYQQRFMKLISSLAVDN